MVGMTILEVTILQEGETYLQVGQVIPIRQLELLNYSASYLLSSLDGEGIFYFESKDQKEKITFPVSILPGFLKPFFLEENDDYIILGEFQYTLFIDKQSEFLRYVNAPLKENKQLIAYDQESIRHYVRTRYSTPTQFIMSQDIQSSIKPPRNNITVTTFEDKSTETNNRLVESTRSVTPNTLTLTWHVPKPSEKSEDGSLPYGWELRFINREEILGFALWNDAQGIQDLVSQMEDKEAASVAQILIGPKSFENNTSREELARQVDPADKLRIDAMNIEEMILYWLQSPYGAFDKDSPLKAYFQQEVKRRQREHPQAWRASQIYAKHAFNNAPLWMSEEMKNFVYLCHCKSRKCYYRN